MMEEKIKLETEERKRLAFTPPPKSSPFLFKNISGDENKIKGKTDSESGGSEMGTNTTKSGSTTIKGSVLEFKERRAKRASSLSGKNRE